jgi:hypothetical protein
LGVFFVCFFFFFFLFDLPTSNRPCNPTRLFVQLIGKTVTMRCAWCKQAVHKACFEKVDGAWGPCDMGDFRHFVLPSTAIVACEIADVLAFSGPLPRDDLAVPSAASSGAPLVRTVRFCLFSCYLLGVFSWLFPFYFYFYFIRLLCFVHPVLALDIAPPVAAGWQAAVIVSRCGFSRGGPTTRP